MRAIALAVLLCTLFTTVHAAELPDGYQAVAGNSSYLSAGSTGTLTAVDAVTIGEWSKGFNVGAGKTFEALLPAGGAHLSRDITGDPSQIFGSMNVPQGKFFLVNKNGVYFSPSSQVNAAGLVASSLDVSNENFMKGVYRFDRGGDAPVVNAGRIETGKGGAALIGGRVENTGTISAREGSVVLGSGKAATLSFDPSGQISVAVDPAVFASAVKNSGVIRTGGGNVTLTAAAADQVLAGLVNQNGIVEAGGTIDASGPEAGRIVIFGDNTRVTGVVRSHGETKGGFAETSGKNSLYVSQAPDLGPGGEWLIDPRNVVIGAGGGSPTGGVYAPGSDDATVSNVSINNALNAGTSVTINTNNASGTQEGNITVNAPISKTSGAAADLTLTAANDVIVNAPITGGGTSGLFNVRLRADDDFSGAGNVTINANVNPGTGGELELRGMNLSVNVPLEGNFGVTAQGNQFNLNQNAGSITPLLSVSVAAGTIRLRSVTTAGAQHYSNVRRFGPDGSISTTDFITELNGPLTSNGEFGGIFLLGALRLNGDVTVRTNGGSGVIELGSAQAFTPASADGDFDLTLSSEYLIGIRADERFGARYEMNIGSLTIPEAVAANLSFVYLTANSVDLTADNLDIMGQLTTFGSTVLRATNLSLNGQLAARDFTATAATTRFAANVTMAGGAFALNGPVTFEGGDLYGAEIPAAVHGNGGNVFIAGPVTLGANTTTYLSTNTGGTITLNSTVQGTNKFTDNLTLDARGGDVTFNGGIGYNPGTGSGIRPGFIDIANARNVNFNSYVFTNAIRQQAGTGLTVLRGRVDTWGAAGIDLNGSAFSVQNVLRTNNGGGFSVTNSGTFTTLAVGDLSLDGAFLQDGTGPSRIAGDIRTSGDNITFQRAVTLTGDTFIGTGATSGGNILFGGTVFGTTSGQEDLTLEAGTGDIRFEGQVGYNPNGATGVRVGRLTIRSVRNVLAQSVVTAASILQMEGTGTSTFRGMLRSNTPAGISLTGNNFSLNGAKAVGGGAITVNYNGTVTRTGWYSPQPTLRRRA